MTTPTRALAALETALEKAEEDLESAEVEHQKCEQTVAEAESRSQRAYERKEDYAIEVAQIKRAIRILKGEGDD